MDIELKLKEIKDENNNNLYDHLNNIFAKILLDNPKNPYEAFEEISRDIKKSNFTVGNISNYYSCKDNKNDIIIDKDFMTQFSNLLNPPKDPEDDSANNPINYVPDLLGRIDVLKKCGISLGEELSQVLYLSIKKIVKEKNLKETQFFGKLFAHSGDYYIIECSSDGIEAPEEEIAEPHDPRGQGINAKTHFVCKDLIKGDWELLPIVTPKLFKQSRSIKYMLTGNLENSIIGSPKFDGKEKHFLKCQLIRMSFNCEIVEKGEYKVKTEDDGGDPNLQEIEKEEEFKKKGLQERMKLDNWCHKNQAILNEGRLIHAEIEPENDDIDKEELIKKVVENDPFDERLKPLSKDKYLNLSTCWSIKVFGDKVLYKNQYNNEYSYDCIILLRSLVWEGYHIVITERNMFTLYLGNGNKYSNKNYYYEFPYAIQCENDDIEIEADP